MSYGAGEARSLVVLRHEEFEHLGYFEQVLREHDITFIYSELGATLDFHTQNGLIVMGGPQSANDREMAGELSFIRQALNTSTPIFGICLGAQLIAKALGSEVSGSAEKEIGWAPVFLTDAAAADPVFEGVASPSTFFHWHSETFTLPVGAVSLAYSEKCRQQAFRFGDAVYGVQFHPEITPAMVADWSAHAAACGDSLAPEGPLDPNAFETAGMARRLLEGWLKTFTGRPA